MPGSVSDVTSASLKKRSQESALSAKRKESPFVPLAESSKGPLIVKIRGKWVNLEAWKKVHPGGMESIERFRGEDATDAFESLHSKEAINMLEKMKDISSSLSEDVKDSATSPTKPTLAFREFRNQLLKEGWFERDWKIDFFFVGLIFAMAALGTFLSYSYPLIATILIGVAMQQSGWSGHDYVHGRGKTSKVLGIGLGGLINAFSSRWWSEKHNKHHVHTNQFGVDDDIQNDPILHLWVPTKEKDVPFRAYQHLYYHIVYSFLFVSWRIQSFQTAWRQRDFLELSLMAINYFWLLCLPVYVSIPSVILGGWLVAEIVTATHQSEEIIEGMSFHFVEDQFRTTRDVTSNSVIMNYLWGGMQYQLEHHLFPTMPKYRYPALIPKLKDFAKKNGLDYRTAGVFEMLWMNYETMRKFAVTKST
eukprot:TRINITY_DN1277_c0_g1_i1.p1 TRINITY_DN1277_c0_g1~~TRINITY_DN1277_c0_g1_i1.p1  ORF type:complete len:420 (+),score=118.85 TRINITY_DN1277_c0_g1_i1:187-1446(+)